eukprot:scaffold32984_cov23-Tisochrysis_lutea.AAC.1
MDACVAVHVLEAMQQRKAKRGKHVGGVWMLAWVVLCTCCACTPQHGPVSDDQGQLASKRGVLGIDEMRQCTEGGKSVKNLGSGGASCHKQIPNILSQPGPTHVGPGSSSFMSLLWKIETSEYPMQQTIATNNSCNKDCAQAPNCRPGCAYGYASSFSILMSLPGHL